MSPNVIIMSSIKSCPLLQLSQTSFPLFCCSFFLCPPLYISTSSSFHQTLLLLSKTPFPLPFLFSSTSLTHPLPPPSSPPVKISNFHPPRLCIPPEGRLSSLPISSRSLLAFSRFPVFLILSIARAPTHTEKTHPFRHSPLSFVNTVSSDRKKLPYVPTHHLLTRLYVKSHHTGVCSASALSITSDIKESSQAYRVTPVSDGKLSHHGGKM